MVNSCLAFDPKFIQDFGFIKLTYPHEESVEDAPAPSLPIEEAPAHSLPIEIIDVSDW
jgi:hypothetical protein